MGWFYRPQRAQGRRRAGTQVEIVDVFFVVQTRCLPSALGMGAAVPVSDAV